MVDAAIEVGVWWAAHREVPLKQIILGIEQSRSDISAHTGAQEFDKATADLICLCGEVMAFLKSGERERERGGTLGGNTWGDFLSSVVGQPHNQFPMF